MQDLQKKDVPMSITEEYENAKNKRDKFTELKLRYPKCGGIILFLCSCNAAGDPQNNSQLGIKSVKYLWDFIDEFPPDFQISAKCCDYCKKQIAHKVQKKI